MIGKLIFIIYLFIYLFQRTIGVEKKKMNCPLNSIPKRNLAYHTNVWEVKNLMISWRSQR